MLIHNVQFVISAPDVSKCPKPSYPEYAFIGRSNVGKSSLLNSLTGRKKLAKTSSTPGKTRLINYFLVNADMGKANLPWYLVDLPGYGYAKASKKDKATWQKMTNNYILKRNNLLTTFVLIDSRLAPQQPDTELITWLGKNDIPFVIAFTKADKLTKNGLQQNINVYKDHLLETWEELPQIFVTSAKTHMGKNELLIFIEEVNSVFTKS